MVNAMKVIKFIFFIFILCFSIYYVNTYIIKDKGNINSVIKIGKTSSSRNNNVIDSIFNILNDKDINNLTSLLSFKTKDTGYKRQLNTERREFVPKVYIYNTHQTEEYKGTFYNINPTVMTVSNMIREELETKSIYSVVEERSIKSELNKRGLVYSNSYRISREFLEDVREKYPSITYFFDIHRDSVNRKISSVKINNKNYAKVMFIVTKKNNNYKENEKNVKIMEDYLSKNYEGILRNTYYQPLYVYNQDVNNTTFLIELGGPENTLEEIYNSSVAISSAIEHLMEEVK